METTGEIIEKKYSGSKKESELQKELRKILKLGEKTTQDEMFILLLEMIKPYVAGSFKENLLKQSLRVHCIFAKNVPFENDTNIFIDEENRYNKYRSLSFFLEKNDEYEEGIKKNILNSFLLLACTDNFELLSYTVEDKLVMREMFEKFPAEALVFRALMHFLSLLCSLEGKEDLFLHNFAFFNFSLERYNKCIPGFREKISTIEVVDAMTRYSLQRQKSKN